MNLEDFNFIDARNEKITYLSTKFPYKCEISYNLYIYVWAMASGPLMGYQPIEAFNNGLYNLQFYDKNNHQYDKALIMHKYNLTEQYGKYPNGISAETLTNILIEIGAERKGFYCDECGINIPIDNKLCYACEKGI